MDHIVHLDLALWLGGATFFTGALTAIMGVGGGVMLLAIMASLLPGGAIIPIHGLAQSYSNGFRAGLNFSYIQWHVVTAFVAGMVIGTILAGLIIFQLDPGYIKTGLGFFIILQVSGYFPASIFIHPKQRFWSAGMIGVMSMFFGAPGPLVATAIRQMGVEKRNYAGTHAAVMVILHGTKVLTFVGLGFAYTEYWPIIIAIIIGSSCGTFLGQQLMNRLSAPVFKKALTYTLIAVGLQLVLSGFYTIYLSL